jgi:hypothetical protein
MMPGPQNTTQMLEFALSNDKPHLRYLRAILVLNATTTYANLTILNIDSIADNLESAWCHCLGSMTASIRSRTEL